MAGGTNSASPLSHENNECICKHCFKKVINKVKCNKCSEFFHPACLKQASERKTGCKHEAEKFNCDNIDMNIPIAEENLLNEQIKLLKQTIQDKNTIIRDKESIILLLTEKVSFLEQKLNQQVNSKQLQNYQTIPHKTNSTKTIGNGREHKQIEDSSFLGNTNTKQSAGNSSIQNVPEITVNDINAEILHIETKRKCEFYTNLDNQNENGNKQEWKISTKKKRNSKFGNGNGDEEFYGKENTDKKIWLFVSKVPGSVTAENIEKYVKKQLNSEKVQVKKLKTQTIRNDNQSFMVGVEPQYKQRVYEERFWPKRIQFERFNFKLGQHFLDNHRNNRHIEEENSGQSENFL